jgi:erythrocyte band 7 integral membrane protein
VKQYERAVIFRFGKVKDGFARGPGQSSLPSNLTLQLHSLLFFNFNTGLHFIIPCIDQFKRVDMRIVSCDVPKQEFISKDSVSVTVDAVSLNEQNSLITRLTQLDFQVVYFRVSDAIVAYVNVKNAAGSTSLMAQSTLRNVLGTKTLSEMLANRERISRQMAVSFANIFN